MAIVALLALSVAVLCSAAAIVVLALQVRRAGSSQGWQRISLLACGVFLLVGVGNMVLLILYIR